ncbi:MAG: T9SS type A sorting domain-containing protein [Lewinellaceae bacterium]|nr:T9SS type A sorting domain-containing protein [Lewinellaceae bacterium]
MKTLSTLFIVLLGTNAWAQQHCGYPADANNDGRADYLDLLAIGLSYNATFEPRPDPSTNWSLHCFTTWQQLIPGTNFDAGFADSDGSGTVDSLDINAIVLQYDSLQTEPALPFPQPYNPDTFFGPPCAPIRLALRKDDNNPQKIFADVFLDIEPSQTPGALGVSVKISYNPSLVIDDSTRVLFDPANTDLMGVGATASNTSFSRALPPGLVEFAVAGRGVNVFFQPRLLASIQFIIVEDVIIRNDTVLFSPVFEHHIMVDQQGLVLCTSTQTDTLSLILSTGIDALSSPVRVFPNPARNSLTVEYPPSLQVMAIRLSDSTGRLVGEWPPSHQIQWGYLPGGLYHLSILTGSGMLWHTVAISP